MYTTIMHNSRKCCTNELYSYIFVLYSYIFFYTESEQVCEFMAAVPLGITETKRKMLCICLKFQYNSVPGCELLVIKIDEDGRVFPLHEYTFFFRQGQVPAVNHETFGFV